jgi:hypothetical protein
MPAGGLTPEQMSLAIGGLYLLELAYWTAFVTVVLMLFNALARRARLRLVCSLALALFHLALERHRRAAAGLAAVRLGLTFRHPKARGRNSAGAPGCEQRAAARFSRTSSMAMPSGADCAALCAAIYQTISGAGFDQFDLGSDDGICWGIKHCDGVDVVVLRGSQTELDWLRDFRAFTIPTRIGHVHAGFFEGVEKMYGELRAVRAAPILVTGHSLGAAHADILTALMAVEQMPPIGRVVFGEPRPGLKDHAEIVSRVPGRSYRNCESIWRDDVTDVPLFPYVHPTAPIKVCAPPAGGLLDRFGPFSWHHIELYQAALRTAATQETIHAD